MVFYAQDYVSWVCVEMPLKLREDPLCLRDTQIRRHDLLRIVHGASLNVESAAESIKHAIASTKKLPFSVAEKFR